MGGEELDTWIVGLSFQKICCKLGLRNGEVAGEGNKIKGSIILKTKLFLNHDEYEHKE